LQDFINNSCKISRLRARDRDRNPSKPRRDLRHSRLRLETTGLETRLETETKSVDSITAKKNILHLIFQKVYKNYPSVG